MLRFQISMLMLVITIFSLSGCTRAETTQFLQALGEGYDQQQQQNYENKMRAYQMLGEFSDSTTPKYYMQDGYIYEY